ncbi:hypothetical protein ACA910_010679 [Epithemia clementina (nom. ined.)]
MMQTTSQTAKTQMVGARGKRKRQRPIPIPSFHSPPLPTSKRPAANTGCSTGALQPGLAEKNSADSSPLHHHEDDLQRKVERTQKVTDQDIFQRRDTGLIHSNSAQGVKLATAKKTATALAASFGQNSTFELPAKQERQRSFSLQQKRKEYFTQRELIAMNSETPPRSEQLPKKKPNLCSGESGSRCELNNEQGSEALESAEDVKKVSDQAGAHIPTEQVAMSENHEFFPPMPVQSLQPPPVVPSTKLSEHNHREVLSPTNDHLKYKFYFVEKGRDMHSAILVGPKKIAKRRGAEIIEQFEPTKPPTHFIVSNHASLSTEALAQTLGFASVEDLREFVRQNHVLCCTRDWIMHVPSKPFAEAPPTLGNNHIYRPLYVASGSPNKHVHARKKKPEQKEAGRPLAASPKRNLGVSRMLERLSKLYQQAPLDKVDLWRSYSFQMIAGRLRLLDYDLTTENVNELRQIKGVGSSTLALVKEYLEYVENTGEPDEDGKVASAVERISCIENDPERKALREMCLIWGVGPVSGMELVRAGYQTVADVKRDFDSDSLSVSLSRNQYIGLLSHDDLQEKMDAVEVESIARIVQDAVRSRFPNAQIETLGSYRRKKGSYGDVDFLITHPKYVTYVPPKALGKIVQDLRRMGHIAFHLTWLPGMDAGEFDKSLPNSILGKIHGEQHNETRTGSDKSASSISSYMGIFTSPTTKRLRRVDIKFYPNRERIFALLYFTGNGYFNRSMRLWSLRKFGWTLNDHGLFQRDTNVRVVDSVRTEQEVFQTLQLAWREPHERDCFDAVAGIDHNTNDVASNLDGFSDREFQNETVHKWIE